MQRFKFTCGGWSRRRLVVVFFIQIVAVGLVVSVLQKLPTDVDRWFPQSSGIGEKAARGASGRGTSGWAHHGTGDNQMPLDHDSSTLFEIEVDRNAQDENLADAGAVFKYIPYHNDLSKELERRNHERPRNRDLYHTLGQDHVTIVLYVHNRPKYLELVVKSLAQVVGIEETLLIVSHDGFFPEMNSIVQGIRFCQVKQIFSTFSPHLFRDSFPGQAPHDCKEKDDASRVGCKGNPDQYGNHRDPRIVSLKHHWWWMMNTVWNGLAETRGTDGHIVFIEEDHFILPNAYRTIQWLSKMVGAKCPQCVAVNLAPVDVNNWGEGFESLVVEKVGNIGYAFNRTVWNWIHAMAQPFCEFDDYNWDITMWAVVYPSFPTEGVTLRGPRTSAIHFGKCGLHQGQDKVTGHLCVDDNQNLPTAAAEDMTPFVDADWKITRYPSTGYNQGFRGWGGWGDRRDRQLCVDMSRMYHRKPAI